MATPGGGVNIFGRFDWAKLGILGPNLGPPWSVGFTRFSLRFVGAPADAPVPPKYFSGVLEVIWRNRRPGMAHGDPRR